jgi:hypothetical protein
MPPEVHHGIGRAGLIGPETQKLAVAVAAHRHRDMLGQVEVVGHGAGPQRVDPQFIDHDIPPGPHPLIFSRIVGQVIKPARRPAWRKR